MRSLLVWLNQQQIQIVFIWRASSKHPASGSEGSAQQVPFFIVSGKPTGQVIRLQKSLTPREIKHYCKGFLLPPVWCIYDKRRNSPTMIRKWNQITIGIFSLLLLHQMKPASKIWTAIISHPTSPAIYIFPSLGRHFIFESCTQFCFDSSPKPRVTSTFNWFEKSH